MVEISDERLSDLLTAEIPLGMSIADARSILTELQRRRAESRQAPDDEWRCEKCGCRSFASVDERGEDNLYLSVRKVRCVNCKAVTTRAATPAPLPEGTVTEGLVAAVENLLAHWDRHDGPEKRGAYLGVGYWSPAARMVDTQFVADLRAAFAARPVLDEAEQKRYFDAGWEKAKLLLRPEDLEAARPAAHDLYKTGDTDAPDVIKDRNGEVVLGLCRRCGRGEIELEQPCVSSRPAEPVAVRVKPLEWTTYLNSRTWRAKKPFGSSYFIEQCDDLKYDWNGMLFDELVDAQDACQADYEQRIRSALVSTPAPGLVEALRKIRDVKPDVSAERFRLFATVIADEALSSITETGGAK